MRALLVCVAWMCAVAPAASAAAGEGLSHSIFVKVNGKTITQENVAEATRYIIKREYNDNPPQSGAEMEKIQKAALRDLVRTILIHDAAKTYNVKMDRAYSRQAIAMSGLRPEEITPTIRRMLEADELFAEIMLAEGTPILPPTPKQMRDFYNRNRDRFSSQARIVVRTIFIANEGKFSQAYYRSKADGILRELAAAPAERRTEAVDKKAREVSQDVFARSGGRLTGDSENRWIPKDFENVGPDGGEMFPQAMVDAIRQLGFPGDLRLAVSEEGMHIMYCEDIQSGRVMPWEEASKIVDYVVKARQKNQRMRSWLNRIYDQSDIRWHDGGAFEKKTLTEALLPSEMGPIAED